MKRREFIIKSGITGIALTAFPSITFSQNIITTEELIGKGNPILKGDGFLLREEPHIAFLKMQTEARKSNIHINIVSS